MGTTAMCEPCGIRYWIGEGMFDDRKEAENEIRKPSKDGKWYCKKCGKELTADTKAFILWD